MALELAYGAHWLLPEGAWAAFGARAILEGGGGVDFPQDRMSWAGEDHGKKELREWMNSGPWRQMMKWAKEVKQDSREVFSEDAGNFHLRATPNNSYGYLYILGWWGPEKADKDKICSEVVK